MREARCICICMYTYMCLCRCMCMCMWSTHSQVGGRWAVEDLVRALGGSVATCEEEELEACGDDGGTARGRECQRHFGAVDGRVARVQQLRARCAAAPDEGIAVQDGRHV